MIPTDQEAIRRMKRMPLLPGTSLFGSPAIGNAMAGAAPVAPNTVTYEVGGQVKRWQAQPDKAWSVADAGGNPIARPISVGVNQSDIPLAPPVQQQAQPGGMAPADAGMIAKSVVAAVRGKHPYAKRMVEQARKMGVPLPADIGFAYDAGAIAPAPEDTKLAWEQRRTQIAQNDYLFRMDAKNYDTQMKAVTALDAFGDFSDIDGLDETTRNGLNQLAKQGKAKPELAPEIYGRIKQKLDANYDRIKQAERSRLSEDSRRRLADESAGRTEQRQADQDRTKALGDERKSIDTEIADLKDEFGNLRDSKPEEKKRRAEIATRLNELRKLREQLGDEYRKRLLGLEPSPDQDAAAMAPYMNDAPGSSATGDQQAASMAPYENPVTPPPVPYPPQGAAPTTALPAQAPSAGTRPTADLGSMIEQQAGAARPAAVATPAPPSVVQQPARPQTAADYQQKIITDQMRVVSEQIDTLKQEVSAARAAYDPQKHGMDSPQKHKYDDARNRLMQAYARHQQLGADHERWFETRDQVTEGRTATNPQTGQRIIFQNGKWVPLQ